jgi:hypothetical protein
MKSQTSPCETAAPACDPDPGCGLPEEVIRFLRQLKHDLNNPIGTLGLEIFSVESAVGEMRSALERGDLAALAAQLEVLGSIGDNLNEVFQNALDLMDLLDQVTSPRQGG